MCNMTLFSLLVSRIAAVQQILAAQEETPNLHVEKRSSAAPKKIQKKSNPSYDTDGIELPRPR